MWILDLSRLGPKIANKHSPIMLLTFEDGWQQDLFAFSFPLPEMS